MCVLCGGKECTGGVYRVFGGWLGEEEGGDDGGWWRMMVKAEQIEWCRMPEPMEKTHLQGEKLQTATRTRVTINPYILYIFSPSTFHGRPPLHPHQLKPPQPPTTNQPTKHPSIHQSIHPSNHPAQVCTSAPMVDHGDLCPFFLCHPRIPLSPSPLPSSYHQCIFYSK
ncbi:hypothetical protein EX30DRAFT_156977 [Ascodesmis nigricans]|uniref:Uncharacterized protein n=1 Tax=Ascodesmis nigricans TaxID=341454 RepID=A0A4V3SI23_9PEZI|nr:hypothetical protein EX30DRAFT_156977 [Ascodesmis nigricans]